MMAYTIMCKMYNKLNENIIFFTKKNVFTTNNTYGN